MNLLINLFLALFVLDALLLILVILMQRPKSEGLGAAFGAAVTENIFGAQTTNVLTRITAWLAGVFFVLTFGLSVLYAHRNVGDSGLRRELVKTQGAAASVSPGPGTSVSPTPATANTSPVTSPAPDSGAGVLPAGSASPAATKAASPITSPSPKSKR